MTASFHKFASLACSELTAYVQFDALRQQSALNLNCPNELALAMPQRNERSYENKSAGSEQRFSLAWPSYQNPLIGVWPDRRRSQQRGPGSRIWVRVFLAALLNRFFGVTHWGRDHISPACPLAQIDGSATAAAERKIRIIALYRILANGTAEFEHALARHMVTYCRSKNPD